MTDAEQACGGSPPYQADPELGASLAYSYGDCELPEGEEGCTVPLEIQSRPLCDRQAEQESGRLRRFEVRGVPAVENAFGIDVYAGDTSLSLAGDDPAQLRRAAEALRPVPRPHLPPRGGVLEDLPELDRPPKLSDLPRPDRSVLRKRGGCRFKRPGQ